MYVKSTSRLAAMLGLALVMGGCAKPKGELVTVEQLQEFGYSKFWTSNLPLLPGDRVRAVSLLDDNLYVTTQRGYVMAVQADVGMVRWAASVGRAVDDIFAPTHIEIPEGGGPTVVVTSTEVYIFDRYSGRPIKRFDLEFPPGSAAAGDAQRLYIGGNNGNVYALIWNTPHARPIQAWRVLIGAAVTATPVFLGTDGLVIAARDGTVYACTSIDKGQLWQFRTDGPIRGTPYADDSGVYVASMDRSLYHLSLLDGTPIWRCRLPEPLSDSPVVAGHTIYQYSHNDGLYAVDMERGSILWHNPGGRHFLARDEQRVCVLSANRQLEVLDANTGKPQHTVKVPDADFVASNTRDAALFLVSADGRALCATPGNVPYIRREQAIAARERLTLPPGQRGAAPEPRDKVAEPPEEAPTDPLQSRLPR
jgi:outer membrane protein assembly factor BamB